MQRAARVYEGLSSSDYCLVGGSICPYDRLVAHLRLVDPDDAEGPLAEEYEPRSGGPEGVFNIVRSMSLRPEVLHASMELYKAIMLGPSGLTRQERSSSPRSSRRRTSATTDADPTPTTSVTRAHQTSWHHMPSTTTARRRSTHAPVRSATTRGS